MARPLLGRRCGVCVVAVALAGCGGGGSSGPVAPSIDAQPASVTAITGQPASFTVGASGTPPLAFQWRRNGADIAGAAAQSYSTPAVASADQGAQFSVVIGNAAGTVTSTVATLSVAPAVAPTILTPPADANVSVGATARFSVTAIGSDPLDYLWLRDGVAIDGADSAFYETPEATLADDGVRFTVAVSNAGGSVTSAAARLGVTPRRP